MSKSMKIMVMCLMVMVLSYGQTNGVVIKKISIKNEEIQKIEDKGEARAWLEPTRAWIDQTTRQDTWTQLMSSPIVGCQGGLTVDWFGEKLYWKPGAGSNDKILDRFFEYDIGTDKWTEVSSSPVAGFDGGLAADPNNGKVYWHQGAGSDYYPKKRFYKYNIETDTWTRLTDSPFKGANRDGLACDPINGKVYWHQGFGSSPPYVKSGFFVYNIATNTWNTLASTPEPGFDGGLTCDFINGKLYWHVGRDSDQVYCNRFYEYDIGSNTWQQLSNSPVTGSSGGLTVAPDVGKVYWSDGWNPSHWREFYEYDIASDIWTRLPDQPIKGWTIPIAADPSTNNVYWHQGWDGRDLTNTFYVYGSVIGEPDISTNPSEIIFDYTSKKYASCPSKQRIVSSFITEDLTAKIASSSNQELIPILITMSEELDKEFLVTYAQTLTKKERRQWVSSQLKLLAQRTQQELLSYLESEEQKGKARHVRSLWIVNAISVEVTKGVIDRLSTMPRVSQISYDDNYLHVLGQASSYSIQDPVAPDRAIVWNVQKIRAHDVWNNLGYTGEGIIIGNIDTGVNYNHNDLKNHMWDGSSYGIPHHGWDFAGNIGYGDDDPLDDNGHGTHTAGTDAGDGTSGTQTGVAPDAQIMAVKVCTASGNGKVSDMAAGVQFCIDYGAHVISMSLGVENPSGATKYTCRDICINAFAVDLPMAIAAGNGKSSGGHYPVPDDINSPGDAPAPWYPPGSYRNDYCWHSACMAVGATNSSDVIASFSSYGPTFWYNEYPYPPGLMKPDVSAPGVNITSLSHTSNSGYVSGWSGTSMATPHLAGTIALMLEKNPVLTCVEIDSIIENFGVVDLGASGRDNYYGAGRIDAYDAVVAVPVTTARKGTFYTLNAPSAGLHLSVDSITWIASWIKDVRLTKFKVGVGDSMGVDVWVDSAGMGPNGVYWDTLWIYSNDPDENPYPEPVCLITTIIGIEETEKTTQLPVASGLCHICPNPFRSATQITYTVAKESEVSLVVYNVLGQQIKTLFNKNLTPGYYETIWCSKDDRGRRVPAGVYFMQLTVNHENLTRKVILLK